MASIRKHGKGWQAQVAMKGIRKSRKFATKAEAKDWSARQEYLIHEGEGQPGSGTLGDLFDRYAREVSPTKRGGRFEALRLAALGRDPLASVAIRDARPGDFADWRDRRLEQVAPGSVIREMNIISAVMMRAWKEWGELSGNPLADVRRPKAPAHRERRVTADEIEALEKAARTPSEKLAVLAFRFAIETGMRQGEIARMVRDDITGSVAHLPTTKNGTARDVPLSTAALALLDGLPDELIALSAPAIDVHFRRVRDRAKISGLVFHDSRHEAITRMARKLDVLALARVVGHRDIRQLQAYFNESPEDLAKRLG